MNKIFKSYDIRGIYPQEFNEEIAEKIGKALVVYTKAKKIVVGFDMREHSKNIFSSLTKGILSQGANVIYIGLCSTPMSYFANAFLKADLSIMITASHNASQWNGLKISKKDAVPMGYDSGLKEIEELVLKNEFKDKAIKGKIDSYSISEDYGKKLMQFVNFKKKYKLVIDYANGMGVLEFNEIKKVFEAIEINDELDGSFPNYEANPLYLENYVNIQKAVNKYKADFGVFFDGDADRCGFVDDKGEIIPMDMITAIIAESLLENGNKQKIIFDIRTSDIVTEIIKKYGGKFAISKVGHSNLKQLMRENKAVFGGEFSGHFYFEAMSYAESQALTIIFIANILEKKQKKLSELVSNLKKYYNSGEINFKVKNPKDIIKKIKSEYSNGKYNELDGLKVRFKDWWFIIRLSNTEPLLRLIIEAKQENIFNQEKAKLIDLIKNYGK